MRLKSFRERNKYVLGLVSMAALGALVVATFLIGQLGLLEGGYTMRGLFADSAGIKAGDPVRVAGVNVGSVKSVRPDYSRGKVVVTWTVDDGVELSQRPGAEIMTANILGGRYLRVTGPVPVDGPYMASLPEERRVIPPERTRTPFMINEALKKGTALAERFDVKSLEKLLGQVNKIDRNDRGKLSETLKKLNEVGEIFTDNERDLKKVMASSKRATATITKKDKQLGRLLSSASVVLTQLEKRRNELRAQLGAGNALVTSLSRLIDKHQKQLTGMVDDVNATVGQLQPDRARLNTALAHVGPTVTAMASIGGNGNWLEVIVAGVGPLSPDVVTTLAKGSRRARENSPNTALDLVPPKPGKSDGNDGDKRGDGEEKPDDEWSLLPGLPTAGEGE